MQTFLAAVMGLAHVESAGTLTEAKALGSEVLSVASWEGKGRQCLRKKQINAPVNRHMLVDHFDIICL